MTEIFRQWLRLTSSPNTPMQEVVDFHMKHRDVIVKELQDSWATPESKAEFQAEVARIRAEAQGGAQ